MKNTEQLQHSSSFHLYYLFYVITLMGLNLKPNDMDTLIHEQEGNLTFFLPVLYIWHCSTLVSLPPTVLPVHVVAKSRPTLPSVTGSPSLSASPWRAIVSQAWTY